MHFCHLKNLHNDPELKLDNEKIEIVQQHKFLGMIFDSKLTFLPHIKYLKTKCFKALQLIRTLAHTQWGANKETLLKLYKTLILSKLDYGCMIYQSARKSYLKMLNTIHHKGVRLVLGAFPTSPIESR